MKSWMILKVYPTATMSLEAMIKAVQKWYPNDAEVVQGLISVTEPATANEPPYLILTVVATDMSDIDVDLYNLLEQYPIDYKVLAEREYPDED
ncbi:hypothetical protein [Lacticaseibacillus porcinae]|uniref:hypothetical protein n=1 Tax=Lacticaseibacillus porcinae TaxID=1123687 RepID=UPI000F7692DC|nr:hypothetical protein [Lacticaseibacillus porcinae]